jgi:arylsulfatase A-like enzyme
VETARVAFGDLGGRATAFELLLAALHAIAFYLPAGLLVGVATALLGAVLGTSALLTPLRTRGLSPHLWLAPAPRLSATLLGWMLGAVIVGLGAREAYAYLATVAHRVDLAAWTMGGLALALVVVGFLAATAARAALTPVLGKLGRLGSPAALVVGICAAVIAVAVRLAARMPEVIEAYGEPLVLVPSIVVAYVVCAIAFRVGLRRLGRRRAIAASILVTVAAGAAWLTSASTYGNRNAVRTLVEEETIGGRWLLRRYLRVTDLDGDRHSWGFGGRDCNDFDARVHPGTLDEPGDGVDLDCFGGDGAPLVARPGDGAYGARPAGLPTRPNILLVTIDALRPDHLGIEGYTRDTSPHIDAFARQAVRFREVLAPSSRSIRSIPAMFTGLYPSQIAYGDEYLYPALLAENQTLAEVLRERGWATAANMGTEYFHRVGGFYQGFEQVEEATDYKPPRSQTVDRGIARLERLASAGRPFFHWIHLFHVHKPYLDPPTPSLFGDEPIDHYDTEIRSADEQFQRILDALVRLGRDRDTIVVLASDHGEAFREHGRTGHALTLYQEEVEAVLMFRVPGVPARRVDATVSLLDLAPTLLNLADVPTPHPMPAESLVPLMTGERQPSPDRWLFGELLPDGLFPFDIKTVRHGSWKLHWWVQEGTIQLFDLATDPGEQHDLSDERPDEAHELLGTLQAWAARSSRRQHQNEVYIRQHLLTEPPSRMSHPLDLRYPGLFTVLGCDVPSTRVAPGGVLDVTCYYRADRETDRDLFFRLTIEGPRGYAVPRDMHAMHYPLHSRYRTHQWRAGEILRDPTPIPIPSQAEPGDLWLSFAVEDRDAEGGPRLLAFERDGRPGTATRITSIEVRPAGPPSDAGVPARDARSPGE